mmetsp:Transcript_5/g.9  ORF Transcript_5/g.9 Transcript_5/m.9 type:complete len:289 (-) Transcript_5:996-1862(-)
MEIPGLNCDLIKLRVDSTDSRILWLCLDDVSTSNAFSLDFFDGLTTLFNFLQQQSHIQCVMIYGNGPNFSSGLHRSVLSSITDSSDSLCDPAETALSIYSSIRKMQLGLNALQLCDSVITIGLLHGSVCGAGFELALACDLRICTKDTLFWLPEIELGLAPDLGAIQRLGFLGGSGSSLVREMVLLGRKIRGDEDEVIRIGIVSSVEENVEDLMKKGRLMGKKVVARSWVAMRAGKRALRECESGIDENLDRQAMWNSVMLQNRNIAKLNKRIKKLSTTKDHTIRAKL